MKNMDPKVLAYGFLALCVGIAGFLLYDSFQISNAEPGNQEVEQEDSQGYRVDVDFDDYDISLEATSFAVVEGADSGTLYLYEQGVQEACGEDAFLKTNSNLVAKVVYNKTADTATLKNFVVYRRTIEGNVTEISSVPDEVVTFELTENEDGTVIGNIELAWEKRLVKGEFEAEICGEV